MRILRRNIIIRDIVIISTVLSSLLSGCASRITVPFSPDRVNVQPAAHYKNVFAYTPGNVEIKKDLIQQGYEDHYTVHHIQYPSYATNGQTDNFVSGIYYQSTLPGKKPLVVILPIWGVHTYPSDHMTDHILEYSHGRINVFKLLGEKYLLDWKGMRHVTNQHAFKIKMQEAAGRFRTAGIDIRRFVDWAEQQADTDTQSLAIIGFSIGAMVAGSLMPNEPRFQTGVFVMGGARPQDIFTDCEWRPGNVRKPAMQQFGWSLENYRKIMNQTLGSLDLSRYPGRVNPANVLIFDARYDECIPEISRESMWISMGYPERVSLLYSHETAFLAMTPLGGNYIRHKIYGFLEQHLLAKERPHHYLTMDHQPQIVTDQMIQPTEKLKAGL